MYKLTRKHYRRELKKLFAVLAEMVTQAYNPWVMGCPAECWYEQENIEPEPGRVARGFVHHGHASS